MSTGLGDAMVTGTARIEGHACRLAVMDFSFMGGSMGSVVGEKFARACEPPPRTALPLVSRLGLGRRPHAGGDPRADAAAEDGLRRSRSCTTRAACSSPCSRTRRPAACSRASRRLGDVLLAEPGALMSFAGPRVVAQTTREKLPDDFGLAESNLRFGHIDAIVPRAELRPTLGPAAPPLRAGGHDDRGRARPARPAREAERRQAAARHAALRRARAAAAPARAAREDTVGRGDLAARSSSPATRTGRTRSTTSSGSSTTSSSCTATAAGWTTTRSSPGSASSTAGRSR